MKQYIGADIPRLARAGIRTDHIVINLGNTMGRPDDTRADGFMEASDSSSDTSTLCEPNRHDDTWDDPEKSPKAIDDNIELLQSQNQDRRTLSRCAVRDIGTLLGGFLAIAATGGIGNAVGLLQRYWEDNQLKHYSPRDVGWIAGTSLCLSIFIPVIAGPIFDRYGHFWILVTGTLIYALGILSMSILDSHLSEHLVFSCLVLTYGVLCGMGNGLVTMACSGVVCRIFDKRRGLAAGIMSCGNSVGGVGWPMLLRGTLDRWGWSRATKIMGGIATILLLLGCVLIRAPPLEIVKAKAGLGKPRRCTALGGCVKEGAMCFTKPTFVWMTLSLAVAQFVVMGIVGTLPSWGDKQGFDYDLLFNFVAVMNAASAVGRIGVGALSDLIGRFNSVILTQAFSTCVILALFFNIRDVTWRFYMFSASWGCSYGAILSMMNVLIRELCSPEEFGRYLSASYTIISIAGLLCVPLSAQMLGSFGPQLHVIFFGTLSAFGTFLLAVSRWGIMNYEWKWLAKV